MSVKVLVIAIIQVLNVKIRIATFKFLQIIARDTS